MQEITQIRKLSLWIFFIPLIAINLCLFISQNYELLEKTIFEVESFLENPKEWSEKNGGLIEHDNL